ncbi:MAG TPA: OmpA family protein [Terriglobales bacterium]
MHCNRKQVVNLALAWCLLASLSFAASGDKAKVKGMITNRTADSITIKTEDGGTATVVLDDTTKVQQPKGLGIRKKQVSAAALIPGLKVSVDGMNDDQGRVVAKSITFSKGDLETAEMIQAGLHPTAEQVAANSSDIETNKQNISANQKATAQNSQDIATNQAANQAAIQKNINDIQAANDRFSALSDYDVKGEATVHFKSGSSKISADDIAQLKKLASDAGSLKGYIIEVKGFADSTGNAAMNTALSQDRAQAVINYLVQQGGISVRHIVAPGAYGETNAAATNETAAGRADNRRVEVKVLVNKGVAGS